MHVFNFQEYMGGFFFFFNMMIYECAISIKGIFLDEKEIKALLEVVLNIRYTTFLIHVQYNYHI